MMFGNKCTYEAFLKSEKGIASNILASRLKELEENTVIEKQLSPTVSKNVVRLTAKGIDLFHVIMEVYFWSEKYYEMLSNLKPKIKLAKQDKNIFVKQATNNLKK
jgi:DNA-binding HxlR family transcriptional regulator